jgi:hypothetical protein
MMNINEYFLARVLPNFRGKLQAVLVVDGAHMKTFLLGFHSPKVAVLNDTKHNNNCHVF